MQRRFKFTAIFNEILSCTNAPGYRISKTHWRKSQKAMLIEVEKLVKNTNGIATTTTKKKPREYLLMAFSYDLHTRHFKSMFCIRTNLCGCYYFSRFICVTWNAERRVACICCNFHTVIVATIDSKQNERADFFCVCAQFFLFFCS